MQYFSFISINSYKGDNGSNNYIVSSKRLNKGKTVNCFGKIIQFEGIFFIWNRAFSHIN